MSGGNNNDQSHRPNGRMFRSINPIVVAEQTGVTGTGSTRWRRYNWHGWVLMVVVGVTKCIDDEDADAG